MLNLRFSQINRLVGANIKPTKIEKILKDLGFKLTKSKNGYKVMIPSWRLGDVNREADLIEEIARVYGYDNIPWTTPVTDITPTPINDRRILEKQIKDQLAAYGFDEIYTFAFVGPELLAKCDIKPDEETIEIENPISADMSLMKQSLLPRVMETVVDNLRYQTKFRLFELNPTYHKKGDGHEEKSMLITATVGEDFRTLQGAMEDIGFKVMPTQNKSPRHHPGREADLKNFDIKSRVTVAVADLEAIHEMNIERRPRYFEFSRYPAVQLDISILIPKKNLAADYLKTIETTDKTLITKVNLIDEYVGDKIAENKRALTYSVTYQAPDRTLTDEEVNTIHQQVINRLKNSGAEIR
jgi:phenylalanyl-tRNA synthetase beta chain